MSFRFTPRPRSSRSRSDQLRDRGRFGHHLAIEVLEDRLMLAEDLASGLPLLKIALAGSHPLPDGVGSDPEHPAAHGHIRVRTGQSPYDGPRGRRWGLLPAGSTVGRWEFVDRGLSRPRAGIGAVKAVGSAFRVDGQPGQAVEATFTLTRRDSLYRNEVGLFLVDDASGRIGALRPGDSGYAASALARRRVLFDRGQEAGATAHIELPGGSYFGTYLVPNSTSQRLLAHNPGNRPNRRPVAFFSFKATNPDRVAHLRQPSPGVLAMEDLWGGGDSDFNDAVVRMEFRNPPVEPPDHVSSDTQPPVVTVPTPPDGALTNDTQPPVVTVLTPPDGALSNHTVIVTGRVGDDLSGVATLQVRSGGDGGPLVDVPFDRSGGGFHFPANLALDGTAEGVHQYAFRATDRAGNVSGFAAVSFTLDTRAPSIVVASPAAGTSTRTGPAVRGHVADNGTGVASFEAQLDSGPYVPLDLDPADGTFLFPTTLATDGSADGPHIVRLRAIDRAGNAASSEVAFTLDTQAPAVSIQSPTPGLTTSVNVTVAGTTTDATSGVMSLVGQLDSGPTFSVSFDASTGGFNFPTTLALDGSADGSHTVHLRATDRAGNVSQSFGVTFTLDTGLHDPSCDFSGGLAGWTVAQGGGTPAGQGSVTVEGPDAVLREGNSFTVTLERTFLVPANPSIVSFTFAGLAFDNTANGLIRDAFEAALVDSSGRPLVHTIGTGRDAFFNVTEGLPTALGAEAELDGQTVYVDLSGVTPGVAATLILRLVNNDGDTGTSVHITCAQIPPAITPGPSGESDGVTTQQARLGQSEPVDFAALSDVSSSFVAEYTRTSYNEDAKLLYAEVAVRNAGQYPADVPLLVGVAHISDPSVRVRDPDGVLPDGIPYYDFTGLMAGRTLAPAGSTAPLSLTFSNPGRVPFTYDLIFFGQLNRAPAFTSEPVAEALVGRTYAYNAAANDPDGDTLTFSLLSGPAGMAVNPASGRITWTPTAADLGNHAVAVRVEDGRGGSELQRFVLSAIVPPPNRPPIFTSVPGVSASLNDPYTYQATASDPDGDPLTFSLPAAVSLPIANPGFEDPVLSENSLGALSAWTIDGGGGAGSWNPTSTAFTGGQVPEGQNVAFSNGSTISQALSSLLTAETVYTLRVDIGHRSDTALPDYQIELWAGETLLGSTSSPLPDPGTFGTATVHYEALDDDPSLGQPLQIRLRSSGVQVIFDNVRLIAQPRLPEGVQPQFPEGMSIDPFTGLISWTPTAGQLGSQDVTVLVADGHGGTATQTYSIDVAAARGNRRPVIVSEPSTTFVPSTSPGGKVVVANDEWTLSDTGFSSAPDTGRFVENLLDLFTGGKPGSFLAVTRAPFIFGSQLASVVRAAGNEWTVVSEIGSDLSDLANYDAVFLTTDPTLHLDNKALIAYVQSGGNVYLCSGVGYGPSPEAAALAEFLSYYGLEYETSQYNTIWENAPINSMSPLFAGVSALYQGVGLSILEIDPVGGLGSVIATLNGEGLYGFVDTHSFSYTYHVQAIDPDQDSLTYRLLRQPAYMSIDAATGVISSPATAHPGQYPVTVRVEDGRGGFDEQSFTINVNSASGEIRGTKFHDLDGDGARDGGVTGTGTLPPATDLFVDPFYAGLYSVHDLGSVPGLPKSYGGLTLKQDDSNILLIGGAANTAAGALYGIEVVRGEGNHIIGFKGSAVYYADAAYNDGGVVYGPGDVLFTSRWPVNQLGQLKPGSTSTDKIIDLGPLGIAGSHAALNFVPEGYPGAGRVKLVSWSGGEWYDAALSPDGSGTFDLLDVRQTAQLGGGPEGIVYVPRNSPQFGRDSIVVSEFSTGAVTTYEVDENGDPITSTRKLLLYGLTGAEGAFIDPVTGDFLFTTFGGANRIAVLHGFSAPHPAEPGLEGWVIFIDQNQNHQRDPDERFTTTDANGDYSFTNLPSGSYTVAEEQKPGWIQSAPVSGTFSITLDSGQIVSGIDFGNQQITEPTPNRPPTIVTTAPTSANIDFRYRYDARVTDPDHDPLIFDLVVKPPGMAVEPTTGTVVWTPATGQVGTFDVILRVQDGHGGVDLQSFQVRVDRANSAPQITSTPTGPAAAGFTYEYRVRAQDADNDTIAFRLDAAPSGMTIDAATGRLSWPNAQAGTHHVVITADDGRGALTRQIFDLPVVAGLPNASPTIRSQPRTTAKMSSSYVYQIDATDPNGDPLTYQLDTFPAGLSISPEGLITWVPQADQVGQQAVGLRVADGRGGIATQSFTIDVSTVAINSPPRIASSPRLSAVVGKAYRYDAVAEDPDGDPVVWSLQAAPAGMSIDPTTGAIRWSPTSSQLGAQSVVLQATDPQGGSATQSFAITVRAVNTPPAIVSPALTQAYVGSPYLYAVHASDPDDDALNFSLLGPPSMTIDTATGVIRWTPTAADVAIHEITVLVNDGQTTARQVFDLDVSSSTPDNPPSITSTPAFAATVEVAYGYQVAASDPEGQALRYSLLTAPAGMSIGATSGLVQWTPTTDQLGSRPTITIAAVDPAGNGATQSFSIVVLGPNHAPLITSTPVLTGVPNAPYGYDVRASDSDNEPLQYRLDTAPAGMRIDPALGRITWAPGLDASGSHAVVVTVSDARGLSASQSFGVTVQADTQAPKVTLSLSTTTATIGTSVTFLVAATDNVGVAALGLTIGGKAIVLDANGRASVPMNAVGSFAVIARATDAAGNSGQATASLIVTDPSDLNPPVASITTPVDDQVITTFLDVIGTASDANLVSYVLEVAPVGGSFVEIGRGAISVVNGKLGRLDPSLLANDSYILRLTATDSGGNTSVDERTIAVAGDIKLGNFTLSFTDLTVPVSGIPITVTRTYDTLTSASSDDFGFGWRLEFADTDLRTSVAKTGSEEDGFFNAFRDKTRVYVTLPGGKREGFTFQPQRAPGLKGSFLGIYQAQFVPDAGVTSTLTVDYFDLRRFSDGSYGDYGGSLPYNPADPAFGGTFTLTTREGIAYQIDGLTGDLITVADRNGNALEFRSDGIFSGSGQKVTFERDPQGRITAVVDPSGQKIHYAYDAKGDLVSVTDRANNTTRFVYRADRLHYLEQVIDPLGRTGVRSMYDDQGRLSRLIDADGHEVRLVHDPDHFTETIYDQLGNPTVYEYDDRGNVLTEIDALGGITRRTYDANNNTLTQTDPLGRTTTSTYDAAGNVLTETDPLGHVTRHTYDSFGNELTNTDPLGNTTTTTYDARGNLLEMRDASGKATRLAYSSAGNPTSIADPVGTQFQFEFDSAGQVTRQVDALGNATVTTYDTSGRPLTETRTITTPTGVRTLVTTTTYDAEGRAIAVRDAEGNVTRTEYDAGGNRIATIDALGRRTEFRYNDRGLLVEIIYPDATPTTSTDNPRIRTEYDAAGREVARVDEAGRRTELRYDKLGHLTETIYPDATPADLADNPRTKTEYDLAGQVIAQIDERGNRTEFAYDAAGRQTVVRDALRHETRTAYDESGRSVAITDALGHTTDFDYDASGRQVQTRFVDDTTTSTAYDGRGRVVARTDQANRITRFEYDGADRLVAVIDALGQRTEYGYDELGNLVTQTDANRHITRHEYDGLGRRTATVLPLGQKSTTSYDAVGNVASTSDFNQDTITFEYDARNRLTAKLFPSGPSTRFTYTPTGQRATAVDGRGTTAYQYDARDHLLSRTEPDGRAIAYTYDLAGNRTSVTIPSGTTRYSFDALNRPATVTDPGLGVTRYTYDALGNTLRTELPNGTVETRVYDDLNRVVFLENTGPAGVISSYRYTLAPTGRRDAVVEHDGRKVGYRYDALDRLIDELVTESDTSTRTVHYQYDPVGNRLARDDSAEGRTTYVYDANDRLLSETLGTGVTQYTYDANGNTLLKNASAVDRALYEWDFENRLVDATVTGPSGTTQVAYRYDVDGIRVSSTVDSGETRYLVDTVQPYAQVLEEYTPGGVILASYVHGNDLLSQDRGGQRSYYGVDGLGSTRALTNASGVVTDRYVYDAFGRTIGQVGVTNNVYLFAGEQRDFNVGLEYLRARYLDIGAGRFISKDPFAGVLNIPSSLQGYSYVKNNPIHLVDPTGQFWGLSGLFTGLINLGARIGGTKAQLDTAKGAVNLAEFLIFGTALGIHWFASSLESYSDMDYLSGGGRIKGGSVVTFWENKSGIFKKADIRSYLQPGQPGTLPGTYGMDHIIGLGIDVGRRGQTSPDVRTRVYYNKNRDTWDFQFGGNILLFPRNDKLMEKVFKVELTLRASTRGSVGAAVEATILSGKKFVFSLDKEKWI